MDSRARVFEAEARSSVRIGPVRIDPCPTCSGGERVKWIGRGNELRMTLTVAEGGDYSVQVDYLLDGSRTPEVIASEIWSLITPLLPPRS